MKVKVFYVLGTLNSTQIKKDWPLKERCISVVPGSAKSSVLLSSCSHWIPVWMTCNCKTLSMDVIPWGLKWTLAKFLGVVSRFVVPKVDFPTATVFCAVHACMHHSHRQYILSISFQLTYCTYGKWSNQSHSLSLSFAPMLVFHHLSTTVTTKFVLSPSPVSL